MRRVLAHACALSMLLALPPAPAMAAADTSASVRAQMVAVAEQATRTQADVDRLQSQIPVKQAAIDRERAQLRLLARAMYTQPASPLIALVQASSLGDAFGRVTEMLAAAGRARATEAALQSDLASLRDEQAELEAKQAGLERQRTELAARYNQLVLAEAASAAASAAAQDGAAAAQPVAVPPGSSITDVIRAAWAPTGRSEWAVRLAFCESTLNPNAVNRSSGAAGLFQFMPRTWAATPWRNQSPFDPAANSQAAAWLWLKYGSGQWDCSYRVGF